MNIGSSIQFATSSSNVPNLAVGFWIAKNWNSTNIDRSILAISSATFTMEVRLSEDNISATITGSNSPVRGQFTVGAEWQHVMITWQPYGCDLSLYIGGTLASEVTIPSTHCNAAIEDINLTIGDYSNINGADMQITSFAVWHTPLSAALVASMALRCGVNDSGALIRWKTILREGVKSNVKTSRPSLCTETSICSTNPCNGHTCQARFGAFACDCGPGFGGPDCSIDLNPCLSNPCFNEATCVKNDTSQMSDFVCLCQIGFKGTLCLEQTLPGHWTAWSTWSMCTRGCGKGIQTRHRNCNLPHPDSQSCAGPYRLKATCNPSPCKDCEPLPVPEGTVAECDQEDTYAGTENNCSIVCKSGLVYESEPTKGVPFYTCGPSTNYEWPFKNGGNMTAISERMPICSTVDTSVVLTLEAGMPYSKTTCKDDAKGAARAMNEVAYKAISTSKSYEEGTCNTSVTSDCTKEDNLVKRSADDDVWLKITVEQPVVGDGVYEDGVFQEVEGKRFLEEWILSVADMYSLAQTIMEMKDNGSLDITIGGVKFPTNANRFFVKGTTTCQGGSISKYGVCVHCPLGKYEESGKCFNCDNGSYQDERGQTMCKPCPSGRTTAVKGATQATYCTVNDTDDTVKEDDLISALNLLVVALPPAIIASILLIVIALLIWWKKKGRKTRQNISSFPLQQNAKLNKDSRPLSSRMIYVCETDQGGHNKIEDVMIPRSAPISTKMM